MASARPIDRRGTRPSSPARSMPPTGRTRTAESRRCRKRIRRGRALARFRRGRSTGSPGSRKIPSPAGGTSAPHGRPRATIAATVMPPKTSTCCSSDSASSESGSCSFSPARTSAARMNREYKKPVITAMPAMSTAVVAASRSRLPRCGCVRSAKSGVIVPNSAKTVCQPSHETSCASRIASAVHPTSPTADIIRPSAMVAQNSHSHPLQTCRRRTMTKTPADGGTRSAASLNQGSTSA